MNINVEFRRAATEHTDDDTHLARVILPTVPEVGELVNIDGEPYRVIERSWAFGAGAGTTEPLNGLWCYVRVR